MGKCIYSQTAKSDDLGPIPKSPQSGRRRLSPASCPLTATHMCIMSTHTHTHTPNLKSEWLRSRNNWGWKGGLIFQHSHHSQLFITLVLRVLTPSALEGHCMHVLHIHTSRQNICTHQKQNKQMKRLTTNRKMWEKETPQLTAGGTVNSSANLEICWRMFKKLKKIFLMAHLYHYLAHAQMT